MQHRSPAQIKASAPTWQHTSHAKWLMAAMLTLTMASALFALGAQAQTTAPKGAAAVQPAAVTAAGPAAPKYAVQDVERVFNYLDKNHDGMISREEGAAFKNIASHFDGADANRDNMLSREEFENAVNGSKPQ